MPFGQSEPIRLEQANLTFKNNLEPTTRFLSTSSTLFYAMGVKGFILKRPSSNSKGLACFRFSNSVCPYPREDIVRLKRDWYFFYYSWWAVGLDNVPCNDLIDIFVVWDDLIEAIKRSGRTDCVIIRGGSETFEPHDKHFFPIRESPKDIDILYIARFVSFKRYDVALRCVHYLKQHKRDCRAVFLEPGYSEPGAVEWVISERTRLGLENNLFIDRVSLQSVNGFLNRSRLSLFTSDVEGLCRAMLQSLLAERPVLCYHGTQALTRILYDDRFFHFYEEQTGESAGAMVWNLIQSGIQSNPGARRYVLEEKAIVFHDLAGWSAQVIKASEMLYLRDGQHLKQSDIVPPGELRWECEYHQFVVGYWRVRASPSDAWQYIPTYGYKGVLIPQSGTPVEDGGGPGMGPLRFGHRCDPSPFLDDYYDDSSHTMSDRLKGTYYKGSDQPSITVPIAGWQYEMNIQFTGKIVDTLNSDPDNNPLATRNWTVSCSGTG